MGEWQVCLRDRWPAYITWDQYERNNVQLTANQNRALSTVRRGPTLLSGLLVCSKCGSSMAPHYGGGYSRYVCAREAVDYGGKLCTSIRASSVDEAVSALVLRALEPAALEVSLQVAENIETERRRLDESWNLRLERAQYEVDRAMRQYNTVEPENRLVARTLERQLEDKLNAQRTLQEEHHRFEAQQPTSLTAEERATIRALAENIPALWAAASTTSAERQTIVRQLIDQIELHIEGTSERAKVVVHWVGGHHSIASFVRPVARTDQLSYHGKLLDRIRRLRDENLTSLQIAERLNTEGWRPPKRRTTFNAQMVRTIMSRNGMTLQRTNSRRPRARPKIKKDEWLLPDLAAELAMPVITLYSWVRRAWVKARQVTTGTASHAWVIRANAQELARLRALRAAPKLGWQSKAWIASA